VPPVIRLASRWKICQIIGMCIGNEVVFDFIELIFVVIVLVFIFVNFSFDIEELIAAFPSTFSAMTLQKLSDTDCSLEIETNRKPVECVKRESECSL
jgi:hypothetical protein